MSDAIRAYVNGKGVDVAPNATAIDAVRVWDPAVAAQVIAGERALTDSRGLPLAPDAPITGGSIMRIVSNRRRGADGE